MQIRDVNESLDSARVQLAWFKEQYFGTKNDCAKDSAAASKNGSDVLETEDEDSTSEQSSTETDTPANEKRKRGQQSGGKGHGRSDRTNLEDKPVQLTIENCVCLKCSKPYRLLPETDDSRQTAISIVLFQYLYQRERYASQCSCEGKNLVTAPPPPRLYQRTNLDNSLWVHLAVCRFLNGEPPNRTLKDLSLKGLSLAAGTVVGGFKIIDPLLDPLYEEIVKRCQSASLWNGDETSHKVFEDSDGVRAQKQWWDWVFASPDAIVYILDRSRSKAIPLNFFAGSSGVLVSDRLGRYKNLQEAMDNAWCWVHQRRDFLKIFKGIPNLKEWAKKWMLDITELFILNHQRLKVWRENRSGAEQNNAQRVLELAVEKMKKQWQQELRQKNTEEATKDSFAKPKGALEWPDYLSP